MNHSVYSTGRVGLPAAVIGR